MVPAPAIRTLKNAGQLLLAPPEQNGTRLSIGRGVHDSSLGSQLRASAIGGLDVKRRLRKKRQLAEYARLGFRVAIVCTEDCSWEDCDSLLQAWLYQMCPLLGFERCLAAWPPRYCELVAASTRSSCTEDDRQVVAQWLRFRPQVAQYDVGRLADFVHGPLQDDSPLYTDAWGPINLIIVPAKRKKKTFAGGWLTFGWVVRDYERFGPSNGRGTIRPA